VVAEPDKDGVLDLVVTRNARADRDSRKTRTSALYRNDGPGAHWVTLELVGAGADLGTNRSGVGSRIYLTTPSGTQMREIRAGASFLSQSSLEAEFGLGDDPTISEVRVRWLGGEEEVFSGVVADGVFRLEQGTGIAQPAMPLATALTATWTGEGLQLRWHHAPWLRVEGATVERARTGTQEWVAVDRNAQLPTDRTGLLLDNGAEENTEYVYRISLVTPFGTGQAISVEATTGEYEDVPPPVERPRLGQNFPNPFNPGTTIRFEVPGTMRVRLAIYDARGRHVITLLDDVRQGGDEVVWDGTDAAGNPVAIGTYIYTLHTTEGSESRRLTLLR